MKGGVAAMIDAVRVRGGRGFPRGRIIVAAVVDEEFASIGADALVARWQADRRSSPSRPICRSASPTRVSPGSRSRRAGARRMAAGRHDGRDAILRMGRVLHRLETLDRELQARPPHPLMGTASLHASIIEGGQELSSYPARCLLQMERRTVLGESGEQARGEVDEILAALRRDDPEFEAQAQVTLRASAVRDPRTAM